LFLATHCIECLDLQDYGDKVKYTNSPQQFSACQQYVKVNKQKSVPYN